VNTLILQRAVPKAFDKQMGNLQAKVNITSIVDVFFLLARLV